MVSMSPEMNIINGHTNPIKYDVTNVHVTSCKKLIFWYRELIPNLEL